jgi:hypothetical protein
MARSNQGEAPSRLRMAAASTAGRQVLVQALRRVRPSTEPGGSRPLRPLLGQRTRPGAIEDAEAEGRQTQQEEDPTAEDSEAMRLTS